MIVKSGSPLKFHGDRDILPVGPSKQELHTRPTWRRGWSLGNECEDRGADCVPPAFVEPNSRDRHRADYAPRIRKGGPRWIVYEVAGTLLQLIHGEALRILVPCFVKFRVKQIQTLLPVNDNHSRKIEELTVLDWEPRGGVQRTLPGLGTGFDSRGPNGQAPSPKQTFTCRSLRTPPRDISGACSTIPPLARICPAVVWRSVPCGTPLAASRRVRPAAPEKTSPAPGSALVPPLTTTNSSGTVVSALEPKRASVDPRIPSPIFGPGVKSATIPPMPYALEHSLRWSLSPSESRRSDDTTVYWSAHPT